MHGPAQHLGNQGCKMACRSLLDRHRLETCLSAVIFLGLFVYLWKGIGLHLLYCGFGVFAAYPFVSLERSFFVHTFTTPGGPVDALAALLAHTYSYAWLGALTIAAVLGVLFVGIRRLLRSGQADRFRDLAWVPPLLAVTICNNYYENPLPTALAVGLSVWTAILYGALPMRTTRGRAAAFLILFAAVYYLAGASAFVFAGVACLMEVLLHRRIVLAVGQMALAVGTALVLGWLVLDLRLPAVYTAGTPWEPDEALKLSPLANWLAIVLYAYVPGMILVAFLGQALMEADARRATQRGRPQGKSQNASKARGAPWRQADSRAWVGVRMLAVAATAVLCLAFSRTHARFERALHYHAQRRDWNQVLALAGRMRSKQRFTRTGVFDINRALAHQGRLGS